MDMRQRIRLSKGGPFGGPHKPRANDTLRDAITPCCCYQCCCCWCRRYCWCYCCCRGVGVVRRWRARNLFVSLLQLLLLITGPPAPRLKGLPNAEVPPLDTTAAEKQPHRSGGGRCSSSRESPICNTPDPESQGPPKEGLPHGRGPQLIKEGPLLGLRTRFCELHRLSTGS